MNTPTHFLMTAAIAKAFPNWPVAGKSFLLGSVAPDVPLYLLSAGAFVYFPATQGWTPSETAQHVYGNLFYNDRLWITLHNALHSPTMLLFGLLLIWIVKGSSTENRMLTSWWAWFAIGCLLHSAVDIVTHYDDGPLIFWPLNWRYRFASSVSYWDPARYGRQFMFFELALVVGLVGYLIGPWFRKIVSSN